MGPGPAVTPGPAGSGPAAVLAVRCPAARVAIRGPTAGNPVAGAQPPSWPSAGPGAGWQPSWPTPGQSSPPPPSWPGGGADQPPPPPGAWPPAGQPPFPSPGYTYGYGPRPPRRRWRPRFLGAIITLGVIIVLGVVVGNIGKSHGTVSVSVTPFPSGASASAGHQVLPGRIGSSFELKDGSGNVYRVTLVKVIDPAKGENQFTTPDTGKRFVGLVFKVKALTGSPKDEDANNDAVVDRRKRPELFGGLRRHRRVHQLRPRCDPCGPGRDGDGFGHLSAAERRDGLDGPVDRAERVRFDGRVDRARLAGQGISGTPRSGRVDHGGGIPGSTAAARLLISAAPTSSRALPSWSARCTRSASAARG